MTEAALKLVEPTYSIISFPARDLPAQYTALVFSRWLRSLRSGNPLLKNMPPDAFYKQYHPFIEMLMKKPDCLIKLAVLTEDKDVVLGFSVSREDVLDYIHVHKDSRKDAEMLIDGKVVKFPGGIGKKLLPKPLTTFTHLTKIALIIWQTEKYKHLKFNPKI